jgi:hypothetical protein
LLLEFCDSDFSLFVLLVVWFLMTAMATNVGRRRSPEQTLRRRWSDEHLNPLWVLCY